MAKDIFTKYGNFNSAEEINEAAKNQLAQGCVPRHQLHSER